MRSLLCLLVVVSLGCSGGESGSSSSASSSSGGSTSGGSGSSGGGGVGSASLSGPGAFPVATAGEATLNQGAIVSVTLIDQPLADCAAFNALKGHPPAGQHLRTFGLSVTGQTVGDPVPPGSYTLGTDLTTDGGNTFRPKIEFDELFPDGGVASHVAQSGHLQLSTAGASGASGSFDALVDLGAGPTTVSGSFTAPLCDAR